MKKAERYNAQNVLALFRGETVERFAEPIIATPSSNRMMQPSTSNFKPQTSDYQLKAYPNPFNESTLIEATLPENTKGVLVITDALGKELARYNLNKQQNQLKISGEQLGYGNFFYSLYINGELMTTKKMMRLR